MNGIRFRVPRWLQLLLLALVFQGAVALDVPRPETRRSYIIVLDQPSLAEWNLARRDRTRQDSQGELDRDSISRDRPRRPDMASATVKTYLSRVDESLDQFKQVAQQALGRDFETRHRYRNVLVGFSARLTYSEAQRLSALSGVRMVEAAPVHRPHTDAGPQWVGADDLWSGLDGLPAVRGESIVVGLIDSGINWEHPSFFDPGGAEGGHDFVNPLGARKGLCSDPEVMCNDKLIGVYDFVEDEPGTEVVEQYTKGKDNSGHGTHVASIAVGNPLQVDYNGVQLSISGVAPNANLISYRVCHEGDPSVIDDNSCQGQAILAALDQAVEDGVQVINYSLGTGPISPWSSATALAMLNAWSAGIFISTSAGNNGPLASSIGSPANAPWITAVGDASHDRIFGTILESLSGGSTPPPQDLAGASLVGGSGNQSIVYAGDYGYPLCGTGTAELGGTCGENSGASNPFPPGTFNGEIVVCDRGEYGRVEKGKNLQLAGAGGMILLNTNSDGEATIPDQHCLPAIHLGNTDGDDLRAWLAGGAGHTGAISPFDRQVADEYGDELVSTSSRGPNRSPAQDILKPDLIAPGANILGALIEGEAYAFLTGTSMSSPHVAGAAALLLSANGSWTPPVIASALTLTATSELARDANGTPATPHKVGAGRPRLGLAANSGLFLDVTADDFMNADPDSGGSPRDLNLASMTDADCRGTCSFQRTVTDLAGGASWSASPEGFPEGVSVTIEPQFFTLGAGQSQALDVQVDLSESAALQTWIYAGIRLTASGLPDALMPVVVLADGGELPLEWDIFSSKDNGWQEFSLDGLAAMPDATFTSGGLVRPQIQSQALAEDSTPSNPYDGGPGVMTTWLEVPSGALWLHAETLTSTAANLHLFLGRDNNGDGLASENEELCRSQSSGDLERCDLFDPASGDYWIVAQNWAGGTSATDTVSLKYALVTGSPGSSFNATGPGRIGQGQTFDVRLSWRDVDALDGEELLGAVGLGSIRTAPANLGIIPVHFRRVGYGARETLPLGSGTEHRFALPTSGLHERAFVDVPPGASSLQVTATGRTASQSNGLNLYLHRVGFDQAFAEAPFAAPAPASPPLFSDSGGGGAGPSISVSGAALQPGRWYAVVENAGGAASSVALRADLTFGGGTVPVTGALWVSEPRPGISQGIDYRNVGAARGLLWYTYTDDHYPAWYLSAGLTPAGNIWQGGLLRFTNDGAQQQFVQVGRVSMTQLAADDAVYSWTLFGESGSERMNVIGGLDNPCPLINTSRISLSGFWGRGEEGLGGASVLYTDTVHAEIHYNYDSLGRPVWLQASGSSAGMLELDQFEGYCPTCAASAISAQNVGNLAFDYDGTSLGVWDFDYQFEAPLFGTVLRRDDVVKLSDVQPCD